jgi:DNA-binding winged helix-turn-helix (wHTH) protein
MPDTGVERPILIVQDDAGNRHITLHKDDTIIGRVDECDITFPERQVSRQHVRIYREDDSYFIQDLDSRNGTWVNGQQLKGSRRLVDGDEIRLALAVRMRFVGVGATAPLPFEVPATINGRLKLDREARTVFVGDTEMDPPLSPPQYRLLELLFLNMGRIITRDEVIDAVWPDVSGEGVSEQAIDALVRRLRDRIAELDPDWQYVVTVRGHGFKLVNAPED